MNNDLIIKIAIIANRKLYQEEKITYKMYQEVEKELLKSRWVFIELFTIRSKLQNGSSLSDISLRVVIYARVSTDHLEQKNSLNNQLEYFKNYIKKNPKWIYITSYIDDGITGTNDLKREQFMKMIFEAKNDKFDLILTK